ncbi:MAG: excinuclease ABC subunit UvrB [Bdellovibrionaceae bacterium]|nr:excinuclease ABC subunit UvrB [Pseudobdellovibrionaceae bacterium]MDW8190471.1 excinuclease ABC subunit UvrB [Pseudobdellovibrionaceae bacterium]
MRRKFQLVTSMIPRGDQPQAIESIIKNFEMGQKHQVLLGVTGSGKTFTMAHVIASLNRPTLVMAHNKTLAAQLYSEFKELFPHNAVEYFVSYYDYYQPEAYIPQTDTYIEKDSSINEQIDRMRHSATHSLFEREDVLIVSSVSCIYGLGSPEAYHGMLIPLSVNQQLRRDDFLRELVRIQYQRNHLDFFRGTFRVRGDVVEVFPAHEEKRALRITFFGNYIEQIAWIDPLHGRVIEELEKAVIYPASHYVTTEERLKVAISQIRDELRERIQFFKQEMKFLEAQRLENRTLMDLEMIEQMGFCSGIENYSRHLTGRSPGQPPPTLIEYFPSDFLCIIDESHVTIPQIGGMYRGDFMRKSTLVEHGFRLPSALDNRPLRFEEFESLLDKVLYVSATPGDYEIKKSKGLIVEMINRPTGLLDPEVEVRPATFQVDELIKEIKKVTKARERVLVTTLTKKSAEDLTRYLEKAGIRVKYLHSEIDTIERVEIIRQLRLGVFDVLVGINLLREGLDIPEVSLVAILDADKEGFLRSERSLIQTIGRAARNIHGRVILFADHQTKSILKAVAETKRRRHIQEEFNRTHGITPQTIKKQIRQGLGDLFDGKVTMDQMVFELDRLKSKGDGNTKKAKIANKEVSNHEFINEQIELLRVKMKQLVEDLQFEEAAKVRDEIKKLQILELQVRENKIEL